MALDPPPMHTRTPVGSPLRLMPSFCPRRPNIDWCESHQVETLRTNVIGTLNVADAAHTLGVHMTLYATGCIFEYDEAHPMGGPGFTEEDKANFHGRCVRGSDRCVCQKWRYQQAGRRARIQFVRHLLDQTASTPRRRHTWRTCSSATTTCSSCASACPSPT